jgi:hypothetical protein
MITPRGRMHWVLGALTVLSLSACRPPADPPATIDVTSPEPLHAPATPQNCVDIFSAWRLSGAAALADEHGLLIGGYFANNDEGGGQLLRVDASGALVWRREIESSSMVSAIVPWEQGYAILVHGRPARVLTVSPAGELSTLAELGTEAKVRTILAHEGRLWLAGSRAHDLWIGSLGEGGDIETLIVEDTYGFSDRVVQLLASEDELVALAHVGRSTGYELGAAYSEPFDTHVISLTHAGSELARAKLQSDGDQWSAMSGNAMVRGPSGNIVVAGYQGDVSGYEFRAWAASVVGSEVQWLQWWSGPDWWSGSDDDRLLDWSLARLVVAARIGPDVLVAGGVGSLRGDRRWHLRIDPATGAMRDEFIAANSLERDDSYTAAAVESPHAVWLVGDWNASGSTTLWACRVTDSGRDQ